MRAIHRLLTLIVALTVLLLSYAAALGVLRRQRPTLSRHTIYGASVCSFKQTSMIPRQGRYRSASQGESHAESFAGLCPTPRAPCRRHGHLLRPAHAAPTGYDRDRRPRPFTKVTSALLCAPPDNKVRFVDGELGESCDLSMAECGLRTGPSC